jgi:hypothetical protein
MPGIPLHMRNPASQRQLAERALDESERALRTARSRKSRVQQKARELKDELAPPQGCGASPRPESFLAVRAPVPPGGGPSCPVSPGGLRQGSQATGDPQALPRDEKTEQGRQEHGRSQRVSESAQIPDLRTCRAKLSSATARASPLHQRGSSRSPRIRPDDYADAADSPGSTDSRCADLVAQVPRTTNH